MLELQLLKLALPVLLVVLAAWLIKISYVKAPPNTAYIISGLSREPRVLVGKGGIRIPFFERIDMLFQGQISVDIKTDKSVPTNDFINVKVDAVAKVTVLKTQEGIRLAAKNFLNLTPEQIASELTDSLQGNMREIVGTLDLKKLNTDRDGFSDQVVKKASVDMEKLGITILSCNIQNITDDDNLIKDLGADNTWKIKKDAANQKAVAQREIDVVIAENKKVANDARVQAETDIAIRNNELDIKKADLKRIADTKAAEADKYQTIRNAEAEMEQRKRKAEALRYEAEQEAAAIKAKGDAEAYAIEQKGNAEAMAMERKAEAYKKYNNAAIIQMVIEKLPEMTHSVASQVAAIDSVNIYGTDASGVNRLTATGPAVIRQVIDLVKNVTGFDLTKNEGRQDNAEDNTQ